jgi:hypothetical protein
MFLLFLPVCCVLHRAGKQYCPMLVAAGWKYQQEVGEEQQEGEAGAGPNVDSLRKLPAKFEMLGMEAKMSELTQRCRDSSLAWCHLLSSAGFNVSRLRSGSRYDVGARRTSPNSTVRMCFQPCTRHIVNCGILATVDSGIPTAKQWSLST